MAHTSCSRYLLYAKGQLGSAALLHEDWSLHGLGILIDTTVRGSADKASQMPNVSPGIERGLLRRRRGALVRQQSYGRRLRDEERTVTSIVVVDLVASSSLSPTAAAGKDVHAGVPRGTGAWVP